MNKILFLTNGHGEDLVAAEIIKKLNNSEIFVLPMVGEGKAFENLPVEILGSRKKLPSGGFSLRNFNFLLKDLMAGMVRTTIQNIRTLVKLRGKIDLTVTIGDIIPIAGALLVGAPFIFVGVNKSEYYQWFGYRYTPWEKWLLKRHAKKIYVRDQLTAENLKRQGIRAEYVGNPLMDCIPVNGNRPPDTGHEKPIGNKQQVTIGFLPGTREDAKLNLENFEKVVEELINLKDPDTRFRFLIATTLPEVPEYMERKPFSEVLAEADLIIGLSGTGNEQAAGSGVPVVSFFGRGAQYNKKFALAQKQLLEEALLLVKSSDSKDIGFAIWKLLHNSQKMREMGKTGKERMGSSGATKVIAEYISKINFS